MKNDFQKIKEDFLKSFSIGEIVIIQRDDGSNFKTRLLSEPYELCGTVVAKFEGLGAYDIERCFIYDGE